jgi:hypothetical protein
VLRNLVTIFSLSTIALAFFISSNSSAPKDAMGQAVPLIPLTSGNATLNTGIPKFNECLEDEIEASKNVNDDPYFEKEPTKDEVFKCYKAIFMNSGGANWTEMTRNIKSGDTNGEYPHITSCNNSTAIYFTSIIIIVLASSFLIQISSVAPSEALTRYYNCIARVANKNATLSMANVDACYNLIFKGALDYYSIKQQPTFDNKDTTSEEDSEKSSESDKGQSDSSNSKTQSEKIQVTSGLYDVFR